MPRPAAALLAVAAALALLAPSAASARALTQAVRPNGKGGVMAVNPGTLAPAGDGGGPVGLPDGGMAHAEAVAPPPASAVAAAGAALPPSEVVGPGKAQCGAATYTCGVKPGAAARLAGRAPAAVCVTLCHVGNAARFDPGATEACGEPCTAAAEVCAGAVGVAPTDVSHTDFLPAFAGVRAGEPHCPLA